MAWQGAAGMLGPVRARLDAASQARRVREGMAWSMGYGMAGMARRELRGNARHGWQAWLGSERRGRRGVVGRFRRGWSW